MLIFNKSWAPFFKWLLAIILILAGLFFGPGLHASSVSDKKNYYTNSGDLMKDFHTAEKKFFKTLGD
ncbi:MAG: hypothetical protein J1F32_04730 [Erysipelotrichales bacterium]|nr:hypothetical protein [Erysipelotrichales bacterium]